MAEAHAADEETGEHTEQTTRPAGDGADPGAPDAGAGPTGFLVIVILWLAVMYFFFMRPKQKKEKERRNQIETLKKGDRVTTIGGIMGTVVKVDEKGITLRVDERKDVTMKFVRAAVHEVETKGTGGTGTPETTNNDSEEDGKAPMPGE